MIRITTISSCEGERAAHLAEEEERVGLLEVSAEDPVSAFLKI